MDERMKLDDIILMVDSDWAEGNPRQAADLILWLYDQYKKNETVIQMQREGSLLLKAMIEGMKQTMKDYGIPETEAGKYIIPGRKP